MEREFYKDGYKLTLKNSKMLSSSSEMIALSGNYGLACSLNILAAEEALKSIFIMLKHFNPNYQIDDFNKVFKSHDYKHKQIKSIIKLYDLEFQRLKDLFKPYELIFEFYEQLKDTLPYENKSHFEHLKILKEKYEA